MKVLLVDDHRLLADALSLLIETRFAACSVQLAGSLAQALSVLDDGMGLVLLDLGLPDASGLDALRSVRNHAPAVRVVVISADDRPETVSQAIELGASGFVSKKADGGALMRALSQALDGGIPLPPAVLASWPIEAPAAGPALTPRQLDVLRLLLQGQANKLICRSLDLSESSVKTHLEAIYRRLGVNNRTQAMVAAARLGLSLKG